VYSATARQASRVEDYGRDEPLKDQTERWNGRVILTLGDTYTEVEEPLIATRKQWVGENFEKLTIQQQKTTDFR
jgi:hypothetical protein